MLSPKRLVDKAKKGIPLALMRSNSSCRVVADKGHFVVYTVEDVRFMLPLAFLKSPVLQELLKVSEEEFGLPGDGPIKLACSASFMEYILALFQRRVSGEVERALLATIDASRCSSASLLSHVGKDQHQLVAFA